MTATNNDGKKANYLKASPKAFLLIGMILALLGMGVVRFATYKVDATHYHANFGLYINGQRDEFKNFTFYEEVQSCGLHGSDNVKSRAHMHEQKNGLIHVHAEGVTWSQFFTNLGYTLDNDLIKTDNGVFIKDKAGNKLSFVLNGKSLTTIASRVIKSEDRLLINYGKEDESQIDKHYNSVATGAREANTRKDPASCSGSQEVTLVERLKYAVGLKTKTH